MALKKCKECGHEVSTKAAACPNCGARTPSRLKKFLWIVAGTASAFVLIPIIIGIILAVESPSPTAPSQIHLHHETAQVNDRSKPVPAHREAPTAPKRHPQTHEAKIASYAIDVEPGDPPGTLTKLKRAADLAAKGSNCAEVIDATYVPASQRFPGHQNDPYFVQCSKTHSPIPDAAYAVYFSEADLKAGKTKNQEQPILKDRALLLCRRAILSQLRHPSSADFSALSAYVSDTGTTNREVMLDFTALNGIGNRIPQRGKCIVTPSGHTDVTILDR